MNISIKRRIYWSFSLLVCLFVLNGIFTNTTLNKNKELSDGLTKLVEPSLQAIEDFEDVLIASKMYTTNWVFLRSQEEDKRSLEKLQASGYPILKARLNNYANQWPDKNSRDSLNGVFTEFEKLIIVEKDIMASLKKFDDYDDPVIKLEAERKIEEEILPRTAALMNALDSIHANELNVRIQENAKLEKSSMALRIFIIALAIAVICAGFFLCVYMSRIIIRPINKIRFIVNGLGKGIIRKVNYKTSNDEIGEMVRSVNNLSEKLQGTAAFATEIGNRNFDSYFKPLSAEDTLGIALLAMRDSIKLSDAKLNDAQHIAHIGSWERDLKTDKLTISDEMFNIFDIDPLSFDFTFQAIMKFIHPDDLEHVLESTRRNHYMAPAPFECRIVSSNGGIKYINIETKVVLGENGDIEKTFGIVQDITERKKAEEALSNNELRFRTLTDNAPVGIFQTDKEGKTIYVNETWLEYTGMTFQEAMGEGWFAAIHPADHAMMQKQWDEKLRKGIESFIEYRIIDKKGNIKWVIGNAVPIFNKSGKILGHIGTLSDITERKQAIDSLQRSEKKYRQIVETAQEGIWLIDENDYTNFINKKMCELIGYSSEELMGKKIYHFMDDESAMNALDQIERRKQGISEIHDSVFVTKSGKHVWLSISTNPVLDEDGKYKGALAMMTDITRRKQHDELLLQSEASLEMKNKELEGKNKELEQFAYVASHDLQEPLRTTSSFVELLQQQYRGKLDGQADKYLTYILQSSDRMKVLINDLLDYSRIGHKRELRRVDCNIVLKEVLADLQVAIRETKAEIEAESLPVINGYPTEIKQLFQNLVINAIKFRKKDHPPQIKIAAKKIKGNWEFTFNDKGIGIEKQHSERVFIIFQRLHTRTEYEGSGIGLAHCKKIVGLHGGKIWIDSTLGEGSDFHFIIPEINN